MSSRVGRYTIALKDYQDPFYQRQLQRALKRQKAQRRKEIVCRVARYSFGFVAMASLWIVMTGLWG